MTDEYWEFEWHATRFEGGWLRPFVGVRVIIFFSLKLPYIQLWLKNPLKGDTMDKCPCKCPKCKKGCNYGWCGTEECWNK